MSEGIRFFVPGCPKPAGSKSAFPHSKTGKIIVTDSSGPAGKNWRADVKTFAWENRPGSIFEGPVGLRLTFQFKRPKSHFGTGRNAGVLKSSAPRHHLYKPDATKVLRSVEDALTGIVWVDDTQVVEQEVSKVYAEPEGVLVEVWQVK